ncbi:hypothetical protein GCM10027085_41090 [Spirosoma aerophilum]
MIIDVTTMSIRLMAEYRFRMGMIDSIKISVLVMSSVSSSSLGVNKIGNKTMHMGKRYV